MQTLVSINDLKTFCPPDPEDYVVFGGTFDPFHQGHLDVVSSLVQVFTRVLIAPTTQNPWKEERPVPVDDRRKMISLILDAEGLTRAASSADRGVWIERQDYEYAADLVRFLRGALSGRLFWAVGEDSGQGLSGWKDWGELDVTAVALPVRIDLHACGIRRRRADIHPAIEQYVKDRKLYQR